MIITLCEPGVCRGGGRRCWGYFWVQITVDGCRLSGRSAAQRGERCGAAPQITLQQEPQLPFRRWRPPLIRSKDLSLVRGGAAPPLPPHYPHPNPRPHPHPHPPHHQPTPQRQQLLFQIGRLRVKLALSGEPHAHARSRARKRNVNPLPGETIHTHTHTHKSTEINK